MIHVFVVFDSCVVVLLIFDSCVCRRTMPAMRWDIKYKEEQLRLQPQLLPHSSAVKRRPVRSWDVALTLAANTAGAEDK